jgi:mannose-6-phosphate isomerase-like protein (cupin superfamily)
VKRIHIHIGALLKARGARLLIALLVLFSINLNAQDSTENIENIETAANGEIAENIEITENIESIEGVELAELAGPKEPNEIENKISAVKTANPGDYILLPSGKRYILTKEEIAITRGEFDYENLSDVEKAVEEDGTEIKTISQAHIAYVYPDGQSTHILKTSISFTAFMRHIQETFFLAQYVDVFKTYSEYLDIEPPKFTVFRASVQYQIISDGIEELQLLDITAYNYDGENRRIKYCSKPDMIWGYVSDRGSYKPTGESHRIEFDVE